jgi:hypothetical protein
MTDPLITTHTYTISKVQKLVDLNTDLVNYRIEFSITSPENKPFEMLIINQQTLDTTPPEELEYRQVNGSISGEVVSDKNIYQNYFIILRSNIPMSVNIELKTFQIEPASATPTGMGGGVDSSGVGQRMKESEFPPGDDATDYTKYVLIGIGIAFVVYFIWSSEGGGKNGGENLLNQSLLTKLKKVPLD